MPVMSVDELQDFLATEFPQVGPWGMRIEQVDHRSIRVRMPIGDAHLRPGGTVSGPTLMGLCDSTMYLLILAQIGPVALAVTTNLNINFLRKPEVRDVIAEGRLLKLGKRLAVGEISIFSAGEDEPVAHATLTYSIPPDRGRP